MKLKLSKITISNLKSLKLLILDVDGILTNGKKLYSSDGKVVGKFFCDLDFTAIKIFKSLNIKVIFLSGDKTINEIVARNRNIDFFYSRKGKISTDKFLFLDFFIKKYSVKINEICFFGDDIFDKNLLNNVGISVVPCNSPTYLKRNADIVLNGNSGEYLVKEFLDIYLHYNKLLPPDLEHIAKLEKVEKQKY